MDPRLVLLTADDGAALQAIDEWAFPTDTTGVTDPAGLDRMEWDRTYGAYLPDDDPADDPADDEATADVLAGVHTTYSLDLPVPGASVDCAGLSWVGVHPQYRRRGVLRAMITEHLAQAKLRGEPVSALHASEATIYGRFGYGIASRHLSMTPPRGAALRDVPGADQVRLRFEVADVDRHSELVAACYDAARRGRPGMVSRRTVEHQRRVFFDPPAWRRGTEALRILIADAENGNGGDGAARGYALFTRTPDWGDTGAAGRVQVHELVARDAAAAHALWSRVLDLDLTTTVRTDSRPTDDALLSLLVDPRSAAARYNDSLWVRLVDVPKALEARRYLTEVDVVLELSDVLLPENAGRWRLRAGTTDRTQATCTPSDDAPDLTLDVRELGSAYLGSTQLAALAAAGLVHARTQEALLQTSAAFSWPVAAYCGWIF